MIQQDKANHAYFGLLIFALSEIFLGHFFALGITTLIAFAKEVYDEYKYGGFDWIDIIYTIAAPLILTLILIFK